MARVSQTASGGRSVFSTRGSQVIEGGPTTVSSRESHHQGCSKWSAWEMSRIDPGNENSCCRNLKEACKSLILQNSFVSKDTLNCHFPEVCPPLLDRNIQALPPKEKGSILNRVFIGLWSMCSAPKRHSALGKRLREKQLKNASTLRTRMLKCFRWEWRACEMCPIFVLLMLTFKKKSNSSCRH